MKWFIMLPALLASSHTAAAEEAKSARDLMPSIPSFSMPALPSMPSISLPAMPDFSMPDFSRMSDGLLSEFNAFTRQIGDSLPILEEMGYEVSTFRIQWGLPPKAKLRLRSKDAIDPKKLPAIAAKASGGMLVAALVSSAVAAKNIQSSMKFGTVILDVDFALPPKIKMSFLSANKKEPPERDVEDLDLACGQALAAN